jgi:4-hydroxy 2-oxovalerate aldolase
MSDIKLLDCTLRDGGYVNDWKFGHDNLISVFERLVDSNVDIIEVGFLDDRRPFDKDRSIMPDTASVEKIYGGLDRKNAMVVGMIDFGTCALENIQPCEESFLDGIRVIFKKHLMHPAMEYCRQLKALGYKVCSQLVSVTSYTDEELLELIGLVNDVKPYAVSMVDTYGLLHPADLLHIYDILDENVDRNVAIGFHGHNNFQLGYANSLTFIEKKRKHDIIVDGTLYGMGKSAGNAPLELIAMRLNDKFGAHYRISPMLEAIEETALEFYARAPWGYKEFFYLCAKNRCHPNYLTYFEGKKNLSTSKIDRILADIEPEDKKLLYDKDVAEKLYQRYIDSEYSDYSARIAFAKETANRKLLIIGPGKNINLQENKVARFIEENNPYIISINYIPDKFTPDCIFITNGKRYHDMTLGLKEERNSRVKFLATTNVECRNGNFDFVINRAPLLETHENIIDNSFLMLIKFLKSVDINEVYCAGFDGYSDKEDNYCNPAMEYYFVKREAVHLNIHMKEAIAQLRETMDIQFITYSAYDEVEDINGASI